ncbi:MAG: acyl-CoA dehydrogenase, partial [Gammaproteobacteria bacterium]|nr:acyl-CoA dehydrogenase [Gammaproteobacteria bacterium]
ASLGAAFPEQQKQVHSIADIFTQQAKRRMAANLRRLASNEDDEIDALAGKMLEDGGYRWDVLSG